MKMKLIVPIAGLACVVAGCCHEAKNADAVRPSQRVRAESFPALPPLPGKTIVDFSKPANWRPDFGRFTDPDDLKTQLACRPDGLHYRVDRSRDDGRKYGSIVTGGYPAFTATNCDIRLVFKAPRRSPVGNFLALKFVDSQGEFFQYRPHAVARLGDETMMTFNVAEGTFSGETWGSRKPNQKWDGPIRLCEINFNWTSAREGEVVFERLMTVETPPRVTVTCEPFCGFVRGRDTFYGHNLEATVTNGALEVSMAKPNGWISGYHSCPGPARTLGPHEIVMTLSDEVPGGSVGFVLKSEDKNVKPMKLTRPWTRVIRFPFGQPLETAWYFAAMDFQLPKGVTSKKFRVLAIDVVRHETPAEAARLDVDTGSPLHLVRDGRAPEAVLSNLSSAPLTLKGRLRVRDYFDKGYDLPVDCVVPAKGERRIELDVPTAFGTFTVSAELAGLDGSRANPWTTFARFPAREVTAQWPRGEFRFGVNFHIARYPDLDRRLCEEMMVAMGCKLSRSDMMSLAQVCPKEGEYLWERSDRLLGELEAHGISLDAIIYCTPYWARPPEKQSAAGNKMPRPYCCACRPGVFRNFCEKLSSRYGTRVAYYEIGNEWDLTRPETLTIDEGIAMQREAMQGLHAGCRDVVCIPNGWACPLESKHAMMHKDFQRRMMSEAKDAYDVYAIHLHGPYSGYARNMRDILKFREEAGITQPWYSNETALTSQNGTDDNVPVCVWQKILFAWSHGSTDYIWYNLRATGYDPKDGEMGYGLMTADFHPRTGMAAFSALSDTFGLLRFRKLLADAEYRLVGRWEGVREGKARTVLAGWDSAAAAPMPIRVRTDAARASVVDLMGNATEVPVCSGTVVWPLGAVPSALVLEEATSVEADAGDIAAVARPVVRQFAVAKGAWTDGWTLDRFAQVREIYQADPAHVDRTWKGASDLSASVRFAKGDGVLRVAADVTDDHPAAGDRLVVSLKAPGRDPVEVVLPGDGRAKLQTVRDGNVTRYAAELPFAAFGLDDKALQAGVRLYVRIEEDDGDGPDGWIEYLPGVAERKDWTLWPQIRFE